MKTTGVLSVLALFVAACVAQDPKPCVSPPVLNGGVTLVSEEGIMTSTGTISYDAYGQRVKVSMMGLTGNQTFETLERVMLFGQKVMYEIDWRKFSCKKKPLDTSFQPMHVPKDAQLAAQVFMGSSSSFGMGALINNWYGTIPNVGQYSFVFTEIGCIPMTYSIYTPEVGWNVISTFNWVIGNTNPMDYIPPFFCREAKLEKSDAPETMLSALKSLVRETKDME